MIPERPAAVCRELTKRFEEVARGTVAELAGRFGVQSRARSRSCSGPAEPAAPDEEAATAAVAELVASGRPTAAGADVVSRLTGVPRNRLYRTSSVITFDNVRAALLR